MKRRLTSEDYLRELEEFRRFPDMNPGPMIRTNLEGTVLSSNVAAQNLFGKDFNGKNWKQICPGITTEVWNKILQTEYAFPLEAQFSTLSYIFNHRVDQLGRMVFVFGTDITVQRSAEKQMKQDKKMATLGTLAAGIAHELNNPAAATRRASQQLKETLHKIDLNRQNLYTVRLGPGETDLMLELAQKASEFTKQRSSLTALQISDKETETEEWLEQLGFENAWEIAPALVAIGIEKQFIDSRAKSLSPDALKAILQWVGLLVPVYQLLHEIYEASSRISDIVVALKNYSFLGQAPVQAVNIHEGIDNTLLILKHKLKAGITVQKRYCEDLPPVTAYGSELNQVWTNILDNAADALKGNGEIIIRTYKLDNMATVEIEDNGPGIPETILPRIFDPFFTTKEPGKGTGLGLSTSYLIITEKHKGHLRARSRPGSTVFTVQLPFNQETNTEPPQG
ncbi:MAG TPA: ATP-binding protein [Saprospiraceae bacterium]|nr:ATP-binding protein [Saprospiraceae bacterium]HNT20812.1 ATP-binding protein [Saprospiraceae bacterium]